MDPVPGPANTTSVAAAPPARLRSASHDDLNALCRGITTSFVHLETRDTYGTDVELPHMAAWRRGEPDDHSWLVWWLQMLRGHRAAGRSCRRARVVSEPFSDYQRWTFSHVDRFVEAGLRRTARAVSALRGQRHQHRVRDHRGPGNRPAVPRSVRGGLGSRRSGQRVSAGVAPAQPIADSPDTHRPRPRVPACSCRCSTAHVVRWVSWMGQLRLQSANPPGAPGTP